MASLLVDYYFLDPRSILIPIEQLSPSGMSSEFVAAIRAHRGWTEAHVALFNDAFSLYWSRTAALAARTRTWPGPRLRHVAVIVEPSAVRPYVQLLNTSAWTLYECDLDPRSSHPEFVAYLLIHGDRMALIGDVTAAAVHNAAYWFDRSDAERAAFAAAAQRSPRPDAEMFRVLATATSWLRRLNHETLQPARTVGGYRPIPETGLLVPPPLAAEPPALIERCAAIATQVVTGFHAAYRAPDVPAVNALCDWLATQAPPLLVMAGKRTLWAPDVPERLGTLRGELRRASGAAVADVASDLRVVDRCTREFLAAVSDPEALPLPAVATEQRGYSYMDRDRRLIAYNLYEAGMERLQGPSLPYAREMLAARTMHEWAHLAVDGGWVPCGAAPERWTTLTNDLVHLLDAVIAAAPRSIREQTSDDLAELARTRRAPTAPAALVDVVLTRMPDYQANLLSQRFLDLAERETYVRHNIRTLRSLYPPSRLWRMLIRYLSEYQYLRFSAIMDPRTFFLRSTWFDTDFLDSGILDDARFDALVGALGCLCETYAVDEIRFRPECRSGPGRRRV